MKPVVRYSLPLEGKRFLGLPTHVVPVDHPNEELNGQACTTSRVVSIDADGTTFETMNTKYVLETN